MACRLLTSCTDSTLAPSIASSSFFCLSIRRPIKAPVPEPTAAPTAAPMAAPLPFPARAPIPAPKAAPLPAPMAAPLPVLLQLAHPVKTLPEKIRLPPSNNITKRFLIFMCSQFRILVIIRAKLETIC